ncbi:ORF6C domain-containing protein [Paenibacillus dokdonensis]|uniref:ORF6C domain-containing protein n=1 Tax=Paenibacillus dokdonensis TaxID=2567944 RepID=A0ABU6GQL8_9BACL|nr:ORF6C domain-containing protein [Paenibacillus dokdonensis]MEC0242019.1 ORF6C domain-containing protein [Paenibacillus dokdonensis]
MSTSMVEQNDFLTVVERQMQLTESQGIAIRGLVEGIRQMQLDVTEKVEEVQMMVQEVRDSVTLTDAERYQLQNAVHLKSNELTKHRYKESDEKFKDMVGRYRRMIWSKMKERFEVAKYSHIRRIDFDDALYFVQDFRPEDYI